jgi:hypothetical protein
MAETLCEACGLEQLEHPNGVGRFDRRRRAFAESLRN